MKVLSFSQFFCVACGMLTWLIGNADECSFYLAPSTIMGAGRGIIAGKEFLREGSLQISPTIAIHVDHVHRCQLNNYVFASRMKNFSMINFGDGMLINHAPETEKRNMRNHWLVDGEFNPSSIQAPFTTSPHVISVASQDIDKGAELFTSYGDTWFSSRNLNTDGVIRYSRPRLNRIELEKFGVCVSNVFVSNSQFVGLGYGLYAKKSFKKGEKVVISPVLTLPRSVVDETVDTSVLMNYCFESGDSQVVLFPLGSAAMINHGGKQHANVEMAWHDWAAMPGIHLSYASSLHNVISNKAVLRRPTEQLLSANFGQLDVAFIATRDIEENEEILLDYGKQWEDAWNGYVASCPYVDRHDHYRLNQYCYQFRHYLQAPLGMFPEHWKEL